jgi:hypothetical protein
MRHLIDQALTDESFVRFAIDVVRGVPAYDEMGEVHQVYSWVMANIRFTKDPVGKEKLCPPQELLKLRAGDCDCIVTLLGAMLMALGYAARVVTIAADDSAPREFSHVYIEVELPPGSDNWMPLDAARSDSQFGVAPPMYYRKRVWDLTDSKYQDVSGLGGYAYTRRLGQDGSDGSDSSVNWGALLQQSIAQVPTDIAVASGQSPYTSFQTLFTPGATTQPAGYSTASAASSTTTQWLEQNWPLVAVVLFAMAIRR